MTDVGDQTKGTIEQGRGQFFLVFEANHMVIFTRQEEFGVGVGDQEVVGVLCKKVTVGWRVGS